MAISVGKLSKMYGISRTALLYYDSVGLLKPSARSEAGYRLYSDEDVKRLDRIMLLREAGVPLNQIDALISADEQISAGILMRRLGELNSEISRLKAMQQVIIDLLGNNSVINNMKGMDMNTLQKILETAGICKAENRLDKDAMAAWHAEFEKNSPEQHKKLLSLLRAVMKPDEQA
ncbi:MAG TPA: MerR family transcriptional regulator [Clostridia bacterium]|nr:MerR family transcriptional regulator [Clostridia bacterium]